MTLIQRLRSFFFGNLPLPPPEPVSATLTPTPAYTDTLVISEPKSESVLPVPSSSFSEVDLLPNWLTDEEWLRDEGVLFGISNVHSDGKLAQIRAIFAQRTAPLEEQIGQHTEKIAELNLFIEQRENHIISLRDQQLELQDKQYSPNHLIQTVVSLCLSVLMCVGNFFLIDVTLQPSFPNHWIAVGVFLSGMFNLFERSSFFNKTDTRPSGRRIVEEVSLPLAASIFILVQSLRTQSVGLAISLFVFVFFVFLLSGKLVLSMLTTLQNDLTVIQKNRQLAISKKQNLPVWKSEIERLEREIDAIRAQKWPVVTALNHAETVLSQLNAQRERLINVFLSEFELARSLRERLTEQQREAMFK